MKLTKRQRTDLARAFTHAKEYLWTGQAGISYPFDSRRMYICHCLSDAFAKGQISVPTNDLAKDIILQRLDRNTCLDNWLRDRIGHAAVDRDERKGYLKIQATRLAWLNSLIEEFSA